MKNVNKAKLDTAAKLGIFASSLTVAAAATYIYSPIIGSHAADSQSASSTVSLDVGSAIALTLNKYQLDLNAQPGYFVQGSINANVTTNSQYGYTLTLEDTDTDTNMKHTDTSITAKVFSDFTEAKTSETMPDNRWGFSIDETNFHAIPAKGSPVAIKRVTTTQNGVTETTQVDFGAKVGIDLTSGTYSDWVLFTAYVNGQDGNPSDGGVSVDDIPNDNCKGFHCITTMQEMTPAICNATTTPLATATTLDWNGSHNGDSSYVPRTVLTDTRDGSRYLISKLADGNCWMSQNLALDLVANETIITSNNDGTTGTFTPNNSTQTTTGINWTLDGSGEGARSYKPQANEAYYQGGSVQSSTPTSASDEYLWERAGNYYNWHVATAGSGDDIPVASDASSSICPKGWRLPTNTGVKSYEGMMTAYGITSNAAGVTAALSNPLNFILSGDYDYAYARLNNEGTWGFYWESKKFVGYEKNANNMVIIKDGSSYSVDTNWSNGRGYGMNIRCVSI